MSIMGMVDRVALMMLRQDLGSHWDWGDIEEADQETYRRHASAIIAAMREPTRDMLVAGKGAMPIEYDFRSMYSNGGEEFPPATRMVAVGFALPKDQVTPESVWQSMISAALSEVPASASPSGMPDFPAPGWSKEAEHDGVRVTIVESGPSPSSVPFSVVPPAPEGKDT